MSLQITSEHRISASVAHDLTKLPFRGGLRDGGRGDLLSQLLVDFN